MAIKRIAADIDVVQAAEQRIKNVFANRLPVYMSFSGGKDSLVMAQLVANLIQRGEIDATQLTVQFIDEEAIFDSIERIVKDWRKKFMLLGAKFEWFCIEVKHFCCFNALTNDESFICWDRTKESVWVRRPPKFAIRSHPKHRPVKDAYQDFLPRACKDGITIVGVRTAESVQRLMYISQMGQADKGHITKRRQLFPIYDWKDSDVWLYLKEQGVEIPEVYLHLWQTGSTRPQLRISQFFSSDTVRSLVKLNEYDNTLMERITRREPNAYLAALYFDSEMFGRNTKTRKQLEKGTDKDYKAELIKVFSDFDKHFDTEHKRLVGRRYKDFFLKAHLVLDSDGYKKVYEGLMSGDPKQRTLRSLYQSIFGKYIHKHKATLPQSKGGVLDG